MRKEILKNFRHNQLIDLIKITPVVILFGVPFLLLLKKELDIFYLVLILFFGSVTFLLLYKLLKIAFIMIRPSNSNLFLRYGGLDNIERIISEINLTIEYEVNDVVVSKKYILDRRDYRKLTHLNDILNIYKVEQRTNGFTDYYYLVMTDKYGFDFRYKFYRSEWMKLNFLYMHLKNNCSAKFGFSEESKNYVKNNIIKIEKNVEEINRKYYCPDCKDQIEKDDKFCRKCGCKMNWND